MRPRPEHIIAGDVIDQQQDYVRPLAGKTTANGHVSRELSYLSPVLNWASHRDRKFGKIGAGCTTRLAVAELRRINDPANDDTFSRLKKEGNGVSGVIEKKKTPIWHPSQILRPKTK